MHWHRWGVARQTSEISCSGKILTSSAKMDAKPAGFSLVPGDLGRFRLTVEDAV